MGAPRHTPQRHAHCSTTHRVKHHLDSCGVVIEINQPYHAFILVCWSMSVCVCVLVDECGCCCTWYCVCMCACPPPPHTYTHECKGWEAPCTAACLTTWCSGCNPLVQWRGVRAICVNDDVSTKGVPAVGRLVSATCDSNNTRTQQLAYLWWSHPHMQRYCVIDTHLTLHMCGCKTRHDRVDVQDQGTAKHK